MQNVTRQKTDRWIPSRFWDDRRTNPVTAQALDRLADVELQHGHVAAAERLSHLAAELRGAQ
jgi:hypothetical protein